MTDNIKEYIFWCEGGRIWAEAENEEEARLIARGNIELKLLEIIDD